MLHPPPRPAEERHSWVGGTAGEPSSHFHPYLNCWPDPRTPPGAIAVFTDPRVVPYWTRQPHGCPRGSRQPGLPKETGSGDSASSGLEDCPTLAQALLRPGSCCLLSRRPECVLLLLPFPAGAAERGSWHHGAARALLCGDRAPGTPPWLGTSHGGMSPGAVAGSSWAWPPHSSLKLLFKREFPGSLFTAAIYL